MKAWKRGQPSKVDKAVARDRAREPLPTPEQEAKVKRRHEAVRREIRQEKKTS